ncbi:MFS transporter [Streptomyces sp. NPDC056161]|uniref:MFS transporter n=1 Tax=Streptomyces sp. NPDC056161 TaxID=3345732 RepID=UPI0035D618D4
MDTETAKNQSVRPGTRRDTPKQDARGRRRAAWAVGAGVVVLALNLRPALVAVSPLVPAIGRDTGLSSSAISLLTSLPLLCFGLLSPLSPRLGRRVGMERALLIAMVLVLVGTSVRVVPDIAALFGGTVVIGAGIAIGNVLLPGLIKRDFPTRVGLMMGVYAMTLFTGPAVAAGVTVPLQHLTGLGWRAVLACWGALAVLAVIVWLPRVRARTRVPKPVSVSRRPATGTSARSSAPDS